MNSFLSKPLFNIFLLVINAILILSFDLEEIQYSILVCSNFVYILWWAWRINKLSPFFLFLTTFCFLFIGGHFWGNLFSPDLLSIRVGSFMDPTPSTDAEWKKTIIYILSFLYLSALGYQKKVCLYEDRSNNKIYFADNGDRYFSFNRFLRIVFVPLAAIVLLTQYQSFIAVMQGGYSAVYMEQSGAYSSNSSLLVLFYFFFAMAMVYGNKNTRRIYLILILIDALIKILAGGRGSFGSFLMFAIWLYSTKWNINIRKLAIGGAVMLAVLLSISQLSKRSQDSDTNYSTLNDVIGLFIYAQGESLSTFEKSREYTYPVLPYVQTFVPGSSFLYAKLIDPNIKNYESSFSLYLSRCVNIKRFEMGDGGGWTLLSDIYVFSLRTWIGFLLLSVLFGYVVGLFEMKSRSDKLMQVILFAVFLRFMILPRTGLNYICPLIVYVWVFHHIFNKFFKLDRQ